MEKNAAQLNTKPQLSGKNEDNVDGSTSRGATWLIVTQMVSKLLTFMLNQMLVRLISPSLFGVSAYLDFLYNTIVFFSREAERLSIQRTQAKSTAEQTLQSIINFGFVPLVIGIPISVGIMGWQLKSDTYTQVVDMANYFSFTLFLYWVSIVLELIVEPVYAVNQYTLDFGRRSRFEGMAMFARCATIVGTVFLAPRGPEYDRNGVLLMAFGWGQLVYSLTLFGCYMSSSTKLRMEKLADNSWFDAEVVKFWKISFVQMIFKQMLTEGDKFIVNTFFSTEERGVFSVLNNYGSIIVRLLFQPIEESVRLSFTRTLAEKSKRSLGTAHSTITYLFIFYLQFSILICLAGSFNASYMLRILLGGKSSFWNGTDLFELFPWYISYIPFLAFNGVVEAFYSAAATSSQTKAYSYFMSASSLVILVVMYVFIEYYQMGIYGLILANSINMTLRIAYCTRFICRFFGQNGLGVSYGSVIKFVLQNVVIGAICFHLNYRVLEKSFNTNSFTDLVKSAAVCFLCLFGLLLTIRKEIVTTVRTYLHRKSD